MRPTVEASRTTLAQALSSSLILVLYCSSTSEFRLRTALSCSSFWASLPFKLRLALLSSSLPYSSALMVCTSCWFSSESLLLESIMDSLMRSRSAALAFSSPRALPSSSSSALPRTTSLVSRLSSALRALASASARVLLASRSFTIFCRRSSSWFSILSRELKRWVVRLSSSSARRSRALRASFSLAMVSMRSSQSAFSSANFLVNSTSSNCRIMILLELPCPMCSSRSASGRHGDSCRALMGDGRFMGDGLMCSRSTLTTSFFSFKPLELGFGCRRCWASSGSGRNDDI